MADPTDPSIWDRTGGLGRYAARPGSRTTAATNRHPRTSRTLRKLSRKVSMLRAKNCKSFGVGPKRPSDAQLAPFGPELKHQPKRTGCEELQSRSPSGPALQPSRDGRPHRPP
jgi:hypothetical protein